VRKKLTALLLATALSAVALSLGATAGAAKPASGTPIRFGYLNLFTGPSAVPSIPQAINAYVDDWNQRGGYKGRPIEVVFKDTGFDPGKSLAAARELSSDPDVIGIASMGLCTVTKPLLSTLGIPALAASDPSCPQEPFMATYTAQATTLPMLQWAIDQGVEHFGVVYPAIPQLRIGFVDPLEEYLRLNPDVNADLTVAEIPLVPTGADFDGVVAKLKNAGVTALFAALQPQGASLALQSANRNGFGPADGVKWIGGPTLYDPTLLTKIPEMEGTYALSTAIPWEETANKQVKKMTKVIGSEVDVKDGFAENGYQQAWLLEQSLKKLKGEVSRESLMKLWQSKAFQKYQVVLNPFTVNFSDGSTNPSGGQILLAKGGKFVPTDDFLVIPATKFLEQ
jgi:ABC-type branched-subunit amino acid transport system substrate-binding protein